MHKLAALLVMILTVQGCSLVGIRSVEEAAYTLVKKEGDFELRMYDQFMTVETVVVADSFDDATDITFNRLFDYISGDNVQRKDVTMTAPVFSSKEGVNVEMTSPVLSSLSSSEDSTWRLAFVLPSHYDWSNVPTPRDPDVVLKQQDERLVAVSLFSGLWTQERFDWESAKLKAWVQEKGYSSVGSPVFAGYDPPWTLPFFRRNEVMQEIVK